MACGVDQGGAGGGLPLTSTSAEPAGANCPEGGVAVHSGIDRNGNGVLDADEIESTAYTCAFHKTLLREDTIGSGAVCPGGGVLVRSGHDVNDDGALEDAEIESTATVCYSDEIFHGDLTTSEFSTAASQEKLSHVRVVTGNVLIDSDAATPSLEVVGGNIDLRVATPVKLPALTRIAGSLTGPPSVLISNNTITQLEARVYLEVPALEAVGGGVWLTANKDEGTFSAPALTVVDGNVSVRGTFSTVDLHQLNRVGRTVVLETNAAALALPALGSVGESLQIGGKLATLDLHALASAPYVEVSASKLASLALPALHSVSKISINGGDVMTSVQLPNVSALGSLSLFRLPQMATIEIPQITTLNTLEIEYASMSDLRAFANVQVTKALTITRDAQLVDLRGLEGLSSLATVTITDNPKLASLAGLEQLAKVTGNLTLKRNAALSTLSGLAGLMSVSGTIAISDNAALPAAEVAAFLARVGH